MNLVFLTLGKMNDIESPGIYSDLLRVFRDRGHKVYIVSANERRNKKDTEFYEENGVCFLRVKTGNITKCGLVEKGISTVMIESQFIAAMKKHLADVKFDLVLYSTPPITFVNAVKYIKKRDGARSYLLLKDIFPQNAVDIGIMSKSGVKGILYKFFRKKEKKLYAISDKIGCMSRANVDYVLKNNPEVPTERVEICPNSIEIRDMSITEAERVEIREKYLIPTDKKVFVYGGNLGRPQGIPFIIECLRSQLENDRAYFLIVGDGTEFSALQRFFDETNPTNMKLMKRLPKEDYDRMVAACDVGLIFLDHRFTIPNYPSRLLVNMQAGIPTVAATDPNTDIGRFVEDNGIGWWCESNDTEAFGRSVDKALEADHDGVKERSMRLLRENYTTDASYEIIMKSL